MEYLLEQVGEHMVFVLVAACFIVGMLVKSFTTIVTSMGRERSRREIAAYVAEGTVTPEHGERLLRAEVRGRQIS